MVSKALVTLIIVGCFERSFSLPTAGQVAYGYSVSSGSNPGIQGQSFVHYTYCTDGSQPPCKQGQAQVQVQHQAQAQGQGLHFGQYFGQPQTQAQVQAQEQAQLQAQIQAQEQAQEQAQQQQIVSPKPCQNLCEPCFELC